MSCSTLAGVLKAEQCHTTCLQIHGVADISQNEAGGRTQLMRQDSNHLWLLALLYEGVIQHYALVLEEAIPACADRNSSHEKKACNGNTHSAVADRRSTMILYTGVP